MSLFADIVFALPLPQAYTYAVPDVLRATARPGARARAPLGSKTAVGFIVGVHDRPPASAVVKPLLAVLDPEPVIPSDILDLAGRLSRRYFSSWGELLRSAIPFPLAGDSSVKAALTEAGRAALAAGTLSGDEAKIAALLAEKEYTPAFLKRKSVVAAGPAVLARLVRKGLAVTRTVEKTVKRRNVPDAPHAPLQMDLDFAADEAANRAAERIFRAAAQGRSSPFLFWGPPARRAAAYLACAREVLARGRQVLFLYPEIGMSEAVAGSFASKLGERIIPLHSRLTDGERREARRRVDEFSASVVAGPRSALFIPLPRLGLIIVDEESDDSYAQAEHPVYDARAGARLRAEAAAVPLIFGSDAPTVETYERARRDDGLVDFSSGEDRIQARIIDDRMECGLLSAALRERLERNLTARRRAIIFIRRKGYASFMICPRCGYVPRCPHCDIALSLRPKERRLACRYCNTSQAALSACPRCGGRGWEPRGAGVEAVAEELRAAFPGARVAVFDSEKARTRAARDKVLAGFAAGSTDILAATPLLVHQADVPPAALIGFINPEQGLGASDFRAGQRVYAEIRRFLRLLDAADPRAEAVLQTSLPDHSVLQTAAAGDYATFFKNEISYRRMLGYPPFTAMAEIVLCGQNLRELSAKAVALADAFRCEGVAEILGPSEMAALGRKGVQIVLKAASSGVLDAALAAVLPAARGRKSVVRYD